MGRSDGARLWWVEELAARAALESSCRAPGSCALPSRKQRPEAQTLFLLCPPGEGGPSLTVLAGRVPPLCDTLLWWSSTIGPICLCLSRILPWGCTYQSSPTLHRCPHPYGPFAPPLSLLHLRGQGPGRGHITSLFPTVTLDQHSTNLAPAAAAEGSEQAKHPRLHPPPPCHPILTLALTCWPGVLLGGLPQKRLPPPRAPAAGGSLLSLSCLPSSPVPVPTPSQPLKGVPLLRYVCVLTNTLFLLHPS